MRVGGDVPALPSIYMCQGCFVVCGHRFGVGAALGSLRLLRPVCLVVALSFALLPLRLLAFVQGAVALLTGDSDLVRVQAVRFMWPAGSRDRWVLCSVADVLQCCCSYWMIVG